MLTVFEDLDAIFSTRMLQVIFFYILCSKFLSRIRTFPCGRLHELSLGQDKGSQHTKQGRKTSH